jgi:cardiolipin synthase
VRILLPNDPDHLGGYLCSFWYIAELEDVDVKFYRFTQGFMHQKVMLIDQTVSTVGTANFDNRSFRLNFEITAIIVDEDFARDVEQMLEEDFARSRVVVKDELEDRSFLFRLAVNVARLTAPVQ